MKIKPYVNNIVMIVFGIIAVLLLFDFYSNMNFSLIYYSSIPVTEVEEALKDYVLRMRMTITYNILLIVYVLIAFVGVEIMLLIITIITTYRKQKRLN